MIKRLFKYTPARMQFFDNFYLRVSTQKALNDPFEFSPSSALWAKFSLGKENVNSIEIAPFEQANSLASMVYGNHGIISLTETNDNLLMWSHYADDHKGIAIEFDAKHDFFKSKHQSSENRFEGVASRVLYRKERFSDYKEDDLNSIYELFFHKSDEWEYEKEHRLLLPLAKSDIALISKDIIDEDSPGLSDFDKNLYKLDIEQINQDAMYFFKVPCDAIKSIIFGCNTDQTFIDDVLEKVKQNNDMEHVLFYKSSINYRSYKLDFNEI